MENRNSQDLRILRKAKRHVSFNTTFMFLLLILYFVSLLYLNQQITFLAVSESFKKTCYLLGAIQILVFALLNSLIMKGRKIARVLYWLVFLVEIGEFYFPMVAITEDPYNLISYIGIILLMLLKLAAMARFGSYLGGNKYAKILFDHILEITEEEEKELYQEPKVSKKNVPKKPIILKKEPSILKDDYDDGDYDTSEFNTEKIKFKKPKEETVIVDVIEEFTFPQLAIKLAIVVYGSLAGFPILTNLLSEFLCSTDGKVVFAMKDIFMLCILSAVLWTFAILFLYYDHPQSKLLCNCCITGEILGILFYLPKFLGYMHNEYIQYAPRVFILFVLLNVIRYVLLVFVVKPIYLAQEDVAETN